MFPKPDTAGYGWYIKSAAAHVRKGNIRLEILEDNARHWVATFCNAEYTEKTYYQDLLNEIERLTINKGDDAQ